MKVETTCKAISQALERMGVDAYRFDMNHPHPRVYLTVRNREDYVAFSSTAPESARRQIVADVRRCARKLRGEL